MLNILKIGFLFIAVWLSIINFGKMLYKEGISTEQLIYQAIGIVGFLAIQFKLY